MSTTVSYAIDGGADASEQLSITADGTCLVDNLDATSVKFTCKGTSKTTRLYVNYVHVTYEIEGSTTTKTATTTAFSNPTTTVLVGGNVTNVATAKAGDVVLTDPQITYSSSATDVATVNATTGEVTGVAAGTATITASYAGNDTYEASQATYDITVAASSKTLIGIEATGTPAEFWKGDTFNHDGMTITATWDDESETDVTSLCTFSNPDMTTAGEKTITVSYLGETCTYTINVKTIANTQATAYTVAEVKAIIDAGKDLSSEVYVKGTVSKIVTAFSESYGNISFNVSADGAETGDQFLFFRNFKGANSEKWTSESDAPGVGDDVIGFGTLTKYNDTYEFTAGNYVVAIERVATLSIGDIKVTNGDDITPSITTNVTGEYAIEYVSDNEDVVLADGDQMVTMGTGVAHITATLVADGYKTAETTFTVTVTESSVVTSATIVWGDATADATTELNNTTAKNATTEGLDYVESYSGISKVYQGKTGLKFGTSSLSGAITINLSSAMNVSKITLNAKKYGSDTGTFKVTVNDESYEISALTSDLANYDIELDGTSVEKITIETTSKRAYLKSVTLSTEPQAALDAITVAGTPEEFWVNQEFNHNGMTVTASYVDTETTKDVTNKATFTAPDMTTAGEKTVNVSYTEGGVTKTATYTITVKERPKYTVTIVAPEGGTLVVKNGETEVNNGDLVEDGTTLTVTATPAEGYKFRNWQAVDGSTHTYTTGTTYTINGKDVTIKANFDAIPQYTYTWYVNGAVEQTTTLYEGATVTAPADPANITIGGVEKVFRGWVETATVDATTEPTYSTVDATATADKTYYAVFATATQSGEGGEVYYEKVPSTYTDWLNGEYLLVYESSATSGSVYNGLAAGTTANHVDNVTINNGKIYQQFEVTLSIENYQDGLAFRINGGQNDKYYLAAKGTSTNGLQVLESLSGTSSSFAQSTIAYDDQANPERWRIEIYNGNFLCFTNDFRCMKQDDATNFPHVYKGSSVEFYLKKGGTTTVYSDFTTGGVVVETMTLAEIEANGVDGNQYTVGDALVGVYSRDNILWAKDQGNKSIVKMECPSTFVDYMRTTGVQTSDWDQSNWVRIEFEGEGAVSKAASFVGKTVNAESVTGVYSNQEVVAGFTSPTTYHMHKITVPASVTVEAGSEVSYTTNVYSPANFWDANLTAAGAVGTNGKTYFFVNPKIDEVCSFTNAVWDGQRFVIPANQVVDGVHYNAADLDGMVYPVWKFNTMSEEDVLDKLEENKVYKFTAVVEKATIPGPGDKHMVAGKDGYSPKTGTPTYQIYPLDLVCSTEQIVTAINDVNADKAVKSVRYYNVAGRAFGEAQPGINIVVTEYTDGSHSTAKVIR